ncbi:MAG: 1-deoxy-D-xylulose-5-phosphate synthase [Bacteroidales bacterium]|nr:1-deoxy-D-xylulose-5-phosphate synthase [Bacteroidales bacterium]
MKLLDNINYPKDIRGLSIDKLGILCDEIREYMIECCAKNPGHLGASLGAVELAVGIHYVFNTPNDKLIWDVGHQAYAHKILTGRKEAFKNNRKLNGLSGFTKRSESEYDPFGAGHTSTSISGALGIAVGEQLRGLHNHIIAVIGDGALSGGLAYEALNNAGSMSSDILVILNDNQISIDKNVGAMHNYLVKLSTSPLYNKVKNKVWNRLGNGRVRRLIQKFWITTKSALLKNGTLFEAMGFRYFGTIDGNDIGQLVTTLTNIKDIRGPKILHVRTIKGKGYKPAEQNQTIWHAPGTFDIKTGERVKSSDNRLKYQEIFGNTIIDLAETNPNIVGITPAMASGCSMTGMMKVFPNRSFDVGIAEEHAVTFSAGLAAAGALPFCNIYSTFLQRAYDNIVHDVALQNLKVIFCIDRAGLVGEDGATHHGAFDLAYLRPIPNITIAAPMNEIELRNIMYSATQEQYGATAIRYPRGKCEGLPLPNEYTFIEPGRGREILSGSRIAILSLGTAGNRVAKAIEQLKAQGITPGHYDMRFLKPLDTELLNKILGNYDKIITIEDGVVKGGLYGAICEYVSCRKPVKIIGMGIPDKFVEQGTVEELVSICRYNTEDIVALLIEEWNKSN